MSSAQSVIERPALFQRAMVRALLAWTKTQTRRAVKLPHMNPLGQWEVMRIGGPNGGRKFDGSTIPEQDAIWHTRTGDCLTCPYGQPGERLWVRENGWERPERTPKMMREGADTWAPYYFDADGISKQEAADFKAWGFKRRPSIHMPRAHSRILLEVTEVRVERLQDITEVDAIAEGVERTVTNDGWRWYADAASELAGLPPRLSAVDSYRTLWEHINGSDSWASNPLVWAVSFRRITP